MSSRTEEILRKVRRMEIATRKIVDTILSGQYHTRFKGQGMQFSDFREYYPGDDIRHIDWKVTARTQATHVKKFEEERDLTVYLMVDVSHSTAFGGANANGKMKRDVIAEVAALVGFAAIKNNDRVGLILFSDRVEKHIPPKKGRNHGLRLISELLQFKPTSKKTNIAEALKFYGEVTKHTAVVFLCSDFMTAGFDRELKRISKKHDVILMQVEDPVEKELPALGYVEFEDLESEEYFLVNTSAYTTQEKFKDARKEMTTGLESLVKACRLGHLHIRTNEDYFAETVRFFQSRS